MIVKTFLRSAIVTAAVAISGCASLPYPTDETNYLKQQKVEQLIQTGMRYYWEGGDLEKVEKEFFKGITLKGKFDVVEASFEEASELAPQRLDLKFGLASTQIINNDIEGAQATYEGMLKQNPGNIDAGILHAAYAKLSGDTDAFDDDIARLGEKAPRLTEEYLKKFQNVEDIQSLQLNTKAKANHTGNEAIVILGYALASDGSMKPPLIDRLKQGLSAAKANPDAAIIVSGGVPSQGVTEAYRMQQWLIGQGISAKRIHLDDKAKDTVGNAIYSTRILNDLGIEHVTLVTSASHMRRALVVFEEVARQNQKEITFDNLVAMDFDSMEEAMTVSPNEKLVIYRDMLRASGLWAYPGIQI
ncbi:YdcF family protein [Candidatus Sororendozoicomonas aggregata]|uniref:YdcF family protein n=1 Tax=Candidatus Sororendozoicomonas aggregata TaxID=3073239 RepID=UPI002ED4589E